MGKDIQIHIDRSDIEKGLRKLENIKNGGAKAVMRAMNRTVMGMKTDAGKEISARYTIKQKDVKEKLEVEKATQSELSIAMRSKGRPVRSIKFKHKTNKNPGKRGAPAAFLNVKRDNSGGFINGNGNRGKGFIATMSNGTQGIFLRTGKDSSKVKGKGSGISKYLGRKNRENIRQVYSPGTVQMLQNKEAEKSIQTKAMVRFNKELDRQIEYLLNQ